MKYSFSLEISEVKNANEKSPILQVGGSFSARNKKNCYKSVRREISSTIKRVITNIEEKENRQKELEELESIIKQCINISDNEDPGPAGPGRMDTGR